MIEQDKLTQLIRPTLEQMGKAFGGPKAEAMLLAIGLQESGFVYRDQIDSANALGPATGFWQFEKNGGTVGVLRHAATGEFARKLCDEYLLKSLPTEAWEFFATPEGDELACAFARLLLWTDARELPEVEGEETDTAFGYYLRNWRPGAWFNNEVGSPKRAELASRWRVNWLRAIAAVAGGAALQPMAAPSLSVTKADILAKIEELRKMVEDQK